MIEDIREYSRLRGTNIELTAASENMVDECPVYEIGAVVNGDAGEVFERGRYEVVSIFVTDDGRIGVESWEDGVIVSAQCHFSLLKLRAVLKFCLYYGVQMMLRLH